MRRRALTKDPPDLYRPEKLRFPYARELATQWTRASRVQLRLGLSLQLQRETDHRQVRRRLVVACRSGIGRRREAGWFELFRVRQLAGCDSRGQWRRRDPDR